MHVTALVSFGARGLLCALGFATVLVGANAFAELPPSPCDRPWWEPDGEVPLVLTEVPPRPHIFLPAREPWAPSREDLLSALEVTVTDSSGALVPGSIGDADPSGQFSRLSKTLRWLPDDDLIAGARYTLSLVVSESPPNWTEYPGCHTREGFSRTVEFTVAADLLNAPTLELSVETAGRWLTLDSYVSCYEFGGLPCVEPVGVCCYRQSEAAWMTSAILTLRGSIPPPFYLAAEFTYQPIARETPGYLVEYPVIGSVAHTFFEFGQGMPFEGTACIVAAVRSLLLGPSSPPLAQVRTCPDFAHYVQEPAPDPNTPCDPVKCMDYGPFWPEPGPEQVEEPPAEDVLPDPDPSDDVSPETKPSSGCAGGGAHGGALFVVILGGLARRRMR